MHNHIFRKIDAARLCEQELGLAPGTIVSVDADNDGMVDGELVILHTDDLSTFSAEGGTVYFGDLVIQGWKSGASKIQFEASAIITVDIDSESGYNPVGSILPCVIFDNVTQFGSVNAHFYGWKFTYTV